MGAGWIFNIFVCLIDVEANAYGYIYSPGLAKKRVEVFAFSQATVWRH